MLEESGNLQTQKGGKGEERDLRPLKKQVGEAKLCWATFFAQIQCQGMLQRGPQGYLLNLFAARLTTR